MSAYRSSFSLLFLVSLLNLAGAQEYRTFNLLDTRSIDARIVEADDEQVVLQRADQLTFTLPQANFSKDDRAIIREWRINDMLQKGTLFELTGTSSVKDLKSQHEEGLVMYSWWHTYRVKVTNDSPYDLEGIDLKYSYTLTQAKISQLEAEAPQPLVSGEQKELDLPGKQSATFNATARLQRTELEPGWTWPGGGDKPVSDSLSPLSATLMFRGVEVAKITLKPTAPDFSKAEDKASTVSAEAGQ